MRQIDVLVKRTRDRYDDLWWEMFAQLIVIALVTGTPNVTRKHQTHGMWLADQRRYFKAGRLAPERVEALAVLGVAWAPYEARWEDMLEGFKVLVREYGSALYITGAHETHGLWVRYQRMLYWAGLLPVERKDALDAAGMGWRMPLGAPLMRHAS